MFHEVSDLNPSDVELRKSDPTVVVIMQVVKISSDVIFKKWIVMFLDDA